MAWDTVIGLEVHVQLKTKSKLFSSASTAFGAEPNTQASFIDAGFPGVLPTLNQKAVMMAVQFGLAIDAEINQQSYFERKNYFYPDLPKGYQISQAQCPIVGPGFLTISLAQGQEKKVSILRAHLEEDAGKSLHDKYDKYSAIDLNRAGTALLEIVTTPCLFSAEEAISYLKTLHQLVRFLDICDGNMQEGSFRCDVNISLKPSGSPILGTRTELKNLNSFRFIHKAITYEQLRQQRLLEQGERVLQETRYYCPISNSTALLRTKENENDYRYFPDPDLPCLQITIQELEHLKQSLPILPQKIKEELRQHPLITEEDLSFLLASPLNYQFFRAVQKDCLADEKAIINWLRGPYSTALVETATSFAPPPVPASSLADLLNYLNNKKISYTKAKLLFAKLWAGESDLNYLLKQEDNRTEDSLLETLIQETLQQYPQQVADYRAGKEKLLVFFIGQLMKKTQGKADPLILNNLIKNYLK